MDADWVGRGRTCELRPIHRHVGAGPCDVDAPCESEALSGHWWLPP